MRRFAGSPKFEVINTRCYRWDWKEDKETLSYFRQLYKKNPQYARLSNAFLKIYLWPKIRKYYPQLKGENIFLVTISAYAYAERLYFTSSAYVDNALSHGVLVPPDAKATHEFKRRGFTEKPMKVKKSGWYIVCHRLDLYYPKRFKTQMDALSYRSRIGIHGITGVKIL